MVWLPVTKGAEVASLSKGLSLQLFGMIVHERLDASTIDLDAAKLIARHGLTGPAARLLANDLPASVPEQFLIDKRRQQVLRLMKVAASARRLHAILSKANLPHLFIKGPMLAAQAYGDWTVRQTSDLDLLIDPDDTSRLHMILSDAGISRHDSNPAAPSRFMRWCNCEVGYRGLDVPLDAHWRLDATPSLCDLPFTDLCERAETVNVAGVDFRTFGRIDAWVFTAIHGTRSGWFSWKWLLDASRQYLNLSTTEREQARNLARSAGASVALELTEALVFLAGVSDENACISPRLLRRAKKIVEETSAPGNVSITLGSALTRRLDSMLSAPNPLAGLSSLSRALGRVASNPAGYKAHLGNSLGKGTNSRHP